MFKEINIYSLREGFTFSSEIVNNNGEILLKKNTSLKKEDVIQWILKGNTKIFTKGELTKGDSKTNLIVDTLAKELLPKHKQDITYQKNHKTNPKEHKLNISLTLEEIIKKTHQSINKLIKSSSTEKSCKKRLIWVSTKLIHLMENNKDIIIDIISHRNIEQEYISHAFRVAIFSIDIAIKMNFEFNKTLKITISALIHDLGKQTYEIINNKENINPSQKTMRLHISHPIYSYKLAKDILEFKEEICQPILNHHEKPNGKGFPMQKTDKDLSLVDKIIYTANIFANLIENDELQNINQSLNRLNNLYNKEKENFDEKIVNQLQLLKD